MDDFKVLEDIGLKEVSNKTHIEVKYLEFMVNSQYEKLNRASTVGFVKILTREYKLDLTDWLNEAEKFWSANKKETNEAKIFIIQKKREFPKYFLAVVSFVVLVLILYGAYVFLSKKLDFFENPLVKTDTNYTYTQTPVVSKAKESLEENSSLVDENDTLVSEENQSNTVESTKEEVLDEINSSIASTQKIEEESNATIEKNTTSPVVAEKKADDYISPNAKLWLGVIYLDNFKRKSFLGKGKFALDSSRDQLITTGHGNFTLRLNGETKKFHSQRPVRMLIKDGKLFVISDKRFKELNRGSIW